MRLFLLATVFLSVMALMNYYVYRRFFKQLTSNFAKYAQTIPLLLFVGEIFFVAEIATNTLIDSPRFYIFISLCVGTSFLLFVITICYDLILKLSKKVPYRQDRRRFIKIGFDITMLLAATSYLFSGLWEGFKLPITNTINIEINNFPINNYKIIQLADLHIGRTLRREFVHYLVKRTNALFPDIIVITGDLFDLPVERIKQDLEPLRDLNAPTYFVLGNHEYFHGVNNIIKYVRTLGIQVLLNESVKVSVGDDYFNLIGINDLSSQRMGMLPFDIDKAYHDVDPQRACIVLAHQPKTIEYLSNRPCDLMLSGHTHGGQIFPFGLLVMVDQPYIAGLHQHSQDQQIFVSRGTGYWGPPLRVLAPSEISQIIINKRAQT